ncbi:unnamed protein product [Adineta ricciae]|uniref:B box-type domain-containing protein n=1 Tax=Adineta ricciae TaxID=249248 RepID=A0A816GPM7_ADIRI|nr:unnamed protein product [Adineta ricciae]
MSEDAIKCRVEGKLDELIDCEEHPDEKLHKWCYYCDTFVCKDCMLDKHRNHPTDAIDRLATRLQTKIDEGLIDAEASLNIKTSESDELSKSSDISHKTIKEEVSGAMTTLKKIIEEYERQIMEEIEKTEIIETKDVDKYRTRIQNEAEGLHTQKQLFHTRRTCDDQMNSLRAKQRFLIHIKRVNEILGRLRKPITHQYNTEGISLENIAQIRELIRHYARVTVTSHHTKDKIVYHHPELENFIADHQDARQWTISMGLLTDRDVQLINEALQNNNVNIMMFCPS